MPTCEASKPLTMNQMPKMESSHYNDERTIYHGRTRETPAAKFLRRICQVMLFMVCMGVIGGIVMGVVAIHNAVASGAEKEEGVQDRQLFVRSYYDNVVAFGSANPTGSAAVPMGNITAAMGTASGTVSSVANATSVPVLGTASPSGQVLPPMEMPTLVTGTGRRAFPSSTSPSATVTVAGVGTADAAQASTEVGMPTVNVTTTVTSTSTTVTNTRTITPTGAVTAASVVPYYGETSAVFSKPAGDCVPVTVTKFVTETIGSVPGVNADSTSKVVPPFTTITVLGIHSKGAKIGHAKSSHVLDVITETTTITLPTTETVVVTEVIGESVNTQVPAATAANRLTTAVGDDQTTTVTVFEQATVIITSTAIANLGTPYFPAVSTSTANMVADDCVSDNATVASVTPDMATVTLSKVVTETYTMTQDGSLTIITGVHTVFETEVVGVEHTIFATGTVGALNSAVTPYTTITVQPLNPVATKAAPGNGSEPVLVSEGTPSKDGKKGSLSILGCVVMIAMSISII